MSFIDDLRNINPNDVSSWPLPVKIGGTVVVGSTIRVGSGLPSRFWSHVVVEDTTTPAGEFETFRKRPSRHMAAGNLASGYDLPGVPWVAYIDEEGVSFHGTFWHNDFGVPRSHGCINMTIDAAKWLYRWTNPVVPKHEQEVWKGHGTPVRVA